MLSKEQLLFSFLCIKEQKKIRSVPKNFENFSDRSEIFFCSTIHKKLNESCYMDEKFLLLKKSFVSLKKTSF